jgi:hypothetical protein
VEVERWLRAAPISDGTRAKAKNLMSALLSHAVQWEFCGHNPISSGVLGCPRFPPAPTWHAGVRVSAKRQRAPVGVVVTAVTLGLSGLKFGDELLVFHDGALGARRLWMDCDFASEVFYVQGSYYWRRGGHLESTRTGASAEPWPMHPALKTALEEWKSQTKYSRPTDLVFPSARRKG